MIRMGIATLLTTVAAVFTVLLAGPASAVTSHLVAVRTTTAERPVPHGPVALASTGLNIAVPVVIGLTALVAGSLLVAWAFLHRGPAGRQH